MEDLNRLRAQDIIVLMLGYGVKLYHKIALLAAGQNEGKQATLNPTDTFVSACPSNDNTEIEATDALDQLYRSGCQVFNVPKKKFLKMHASEEDLKMMVALLKPRYYIPVKGFYKDLLANAEVALSMGINLNHNNVFLLENGLSAIFDQSGAYIFDEKIVHGSGIYLDQPDSTFLWRWLPSGWQDLRPTPSRRRGGATARYGFFF